MKRAVIFDLDGTLWDTTRPLTDYWNAVRQKELPGCRTIPLAELQSWMGQGVRELAHSILPEREVETWYPRYLDYLQGENAYLLRSEAVLYPDLHQTMAALREQGLLLMICSNCGCGYIEAFLHYTGLGDLICDFENPGRTGFSKADNIRLLVERNQIDQAIYVGDTRKDQAAAADAGLPFVHARYGFGQVSDAAYAVDALAQLPALTADRRVFSPAVSI